MFVGSVGWFLSMATDLWGCRVTIFDCTKEMVVWDSNDYDGLDIAQEIDFQGFGDYDLCSYDIWTGDTDNKIHIEINIDMGEEEEY